MLMASVGHTANISLYENLGYHPIKSFEMVTLVAVSRWRGGGRGS